MVKKDLEQALLAKQLTPKKERMRLEILSATPAPSGKTDTAQVFKSEIVTPKSDRKDHNHRLQNYFEQSKSSNLHKLPFNPRDTGGMQAFRSPDKSTR